MNKHTPIRAPNQLNIKGERAYEAAAKLASLTGESLTQAVTTAIEERLVRDQRCRLTREERIDAILEIGPRFSRLPDKDTRSADEILGYDENGLPT